MTLPFNPNIRLLAFFLILAQPFRGAAATIESAGTGDWSLAATWVGGVVPGAGDDVVIKSTHTVSMSDPRSCSSLIVEAGATFNISSTLTKSVSFLNQGITNWSGDFAGAGSITNAGTLNISGIGNHNISTNITNNAGKTINWTGGFIDLNGGQTLINNGTFNLIGNNSNSYTCHIPIVNTGTINKSAGTLTIIQNIDNQAAGSIALATGASLTFTTGNLTQSGIFTVDGTLNLDGGSHTFNTNLTGSGTLNINNPVTVTASSGFAPALPTVNQGFTLNAGAGTALTILNGTTWSWVGDFGAFTSITNDGTLNIGGIGNHNTGANITNNAGKTINWNGGFIDLNGGQTLINNGIFNLIGNNPNSYTCQIPIVNTGTINKSAGALTVIQNIDNQATGSIVLAAGASLTFTTGNLTQSGIFTVDGTVNLNGGSHTFTTNFTGSGALVINNPVTVTAASGFAPALPTVTHSSTLNAGTGTALTILDGTAWNWSGDFGAFTSITNDGTLSLNGIGNHNTAANITNNSGKTINWNNGQFDSGGGGQVLTNNGTLNLIGNNGGYTCQMPIVNTGTINKSAGTLTIIQNIDNQATGSIVLAAGASLTFTTGNLTQSGIFTVDGTVNLDGGSHTFNANFAGSGSLGINNPVTVTATSGFAPALPTVTHSSTLNAGAGTALTIPNGTTWNWSGDFGAFTSITNDGTLSLNGIGNHNTAANITNNAGKTINWNNGQFDSGGGGQVLTNNGTLNLIGVNGGYTCNMDIVNAGTVNKNAGTLNIIRPFNNQAAGIVVVAADATLSFNTVISLTQSGTFTVGGTLNLGGATLTQTQLFGVNGTVNISANYTFGAGAGFSGTGIVNITNGTSTFNAGSTLTTRLNVSGGTLSDNAGLSPGEVTLATFGTYTGSGSPTFANGFIWNGGAVLGSGTVLVSGSMSVNNTSHSLFDAKQLHLSGTGTVNNGASFSFSNTARFVILAGGALTLNVTSNVSSSGGMNNLFEVRNGATLIKSGTGTFTLAVPFSEDGGAIQLNDGTLSISTFTNAFTNGTITIDAPATLNLTSSTNSMTGTAVSGAGTLRLAGTLDVNVGTTITSKINIASGTFNDNVGLAPGEVTLGGAAVGNYGGTGSPTFANGFIWNRGDIQGSGSVTVSGTFSSGSLSGTIRGTKEVWISGVATFTNSGFVMADNAKFVVKTSGSITFNITGLDVTVLANINNVFELESGSTLSKTGGSGLRFVCPVKTTGAGIDIAAGTLTVSGVFTHELTNGTATVAAGANLTFSSAGGTVNLSGIAISGAGTTNISTLTVNANAGTTVSTNLNVATGLLNDNVGLAPGEVTLGLSAAGNGTYGGSGSPIFANGFNWINGSFTGSGIVTVSSAFTVANLNTHGVSGTKEFRIAGAATFEAGAGLTLGSTGKVSIAATGTLTLQGAAAISLSGNSATLFEIQAGGLLTKKDAQTVTTTTAFSNAGTLAIEAGTFNLNSVFTNTGTIKGNGTLDLGTSNANNGTFAPGLSPGTLAVTGNFVNSILDIEIEAGAPVAKDLLNVTGNITLSGSTLNVSELQCVPSGTYDVVSYTGARTGTFATVNAPAAYAVIYNDGAKKIQLQYVDDVPTITCPPTVNVNTDLDECSAGGVALGTPTGTDNCTGVIYTSDAPGTFPIGETVVVWTATDVINQAATCEQSVVVSDVQIPLIICPADQTIALDGVCSTTLGSWIPVLVEDNCTPSIDIVTAQSPANNTPLYGPGDSELVTLTAEDEYNNESTCTFMVTLNITSIPQEICNGIDDDCDGLTDDADPGVTGRPVWYADADGDGFGNAAVSQLACNQPSGYVSNDDDCNDNNDMVNPAATEICNGIDDDCDGTTDEGCNNTTISGTVIWENDDVSGVKDAVVALSGDQSGSFTTPLNGAYSFTVGSGSNFTLTPAKNINKLNGVSTADATRIQQHVANINPITDPYKLVAADVNKSNSITTLDAVVINQSLLGNPAGLNQFKTSWRFVPAAHTMSLPPWGFPEKIVLTGVSGNVPGQDFYGIKTGDVVATFANPANLGNGNAFVLETTNQVLQPGTVMSVLFRAPQFPALAALQCALRFDPTQLSLLNVEPLEALPLAAENFGLYEVSEGVVRLVWSQAEGIGVEEATPVFQLNFVVLQGGAWLSEALVVDNEILAASATDVALSEFPLYLQYAGTTGTGNVADQRVLRLHQNKPNPFRDRTLIGFELPEACDIALRIFDASGRLLSERTGFYPAGKHAEIYEDRFMPGVLYYELSTPFGKLTERMVVME